MKKIWRAIRPMAANKVKLLLDGSVEGLGQLLSVIKEVNIPSTILFIGTVTHVEFRPTSNQQHRYSWFSSTSKMKKW